MQCQEMLQCMGVGCVQSVGEAEALCAALNATGVSFFFFFKLAIIAMQ